ncbi:MAG: hypothetical protein ACOYEV_05125 [Candidatus Nanopelagicales bacterium]
MGLLYLRTRSLLPGILLHAANNALVLFLMRAPGDPAQADLPPLGMTDLPDAMYYLAIGAPLLIWFVAASWPVITAETPYEQYERGTGVQPARSVPGVRLGQTAPGKLTVCADRLILTSCKHLAPRSIPLAELTNAYPSGAGQAVVLVHVDGTWGVLRTNWYSGTSAADLASLIETRIVANRAALAEVSTPA